MMQLTPPALKDLAKLDKLAAEKTKEALRKLDANPKAGHALEGSLKGAFSFGLKVLRTDYRIAYAIDLGEIVVLTIGSHENFYKLATRRAQQIREKQ